MKLTVMRLAIGMILVLLAWPSLVVAQQATTNHTVILRRDPATSSPALEHLAEGVRVTLVDAGPDSGFYHVRTEDDQVGWVFARYITLSPEAPPVPPPTPVTPPPAAEACDASLWNHVYHSYRLIVKQQCIAVTGTIVDATAPQKKKQPDGVRHEGDGDTHGWLKVDTEFASLLNAGNVSDEGGNLVFEIICRFPVTQTDAKAACKGYKDSVQLPAVGTHVRIVGTYVQDTFHAKWNEIHPFPASRLFPRGDAQ